MTSRSTSDWRGGRTLRRRSPSTGPEVGPSHPCTTAPPPHRPSPCLICDLAAVRQGASRRFDAQTIRCGGARRTLGFDPRIRPNFAHFLSCGIPGEIGGERYKQSPQLVEAYLEAQPPFEAPGRFIVFKRWDRLDADDDPAVVVFFAPPDVLSGLFTLANFDEADLHAVIAPFGAGSASIVYHPYRQLSTDRPRAVLGMFDVSARPCVPPRCAHLRRPLAQVRPYGGQHPGELPHHRHLAPRPRPHPGAPSLNRPAATDHRHSQKPMNTKTRRNA